MVGILKLAVVDPSIEEVEDGVRDQAEDVLYERSHLWVARFTVSVNG